MKTEQQIREAIGRDLMKFIPKKTAIEKLKSLDINLDILELAEEQKVYAPEAWQVITDAVQEEGEFWDYCIQWAYETTGKPDIKLYPIALLVKQLATHHGIKALREAHALGY